MNEVLEEVQEISRGIHPAILTTGGLGPALRTLARRATIPVELELELDDRLPRPIEAARVLRGLRGADQRRQARRSASFVEVVRRGARRRRSS